MRRRKKRKGAKLHKQLTMGRRGLINLQPSWRVPLPCSKFSVPNVTLLLSAVFSIPLSSKEKKKNKQELILLALAQNTTCLFTVVLESLRLFPPPPDALPFFMLPVDELCLFTLSLNKLRLLSSRPDVLLPHLHAIYVRPPCAPGLFLRHRCALPPQYLFLPLKR